MPNTGRIEGTRSEILAILRRREGIAVDELAQELGLAGATVRRHLDVLLRDSYVSVSQVRGGTGRPKHIFHLTEAGAELFPHQYVRLTRRLVEAIAGLDGDETAGRSGTQIADLVFERMAQRVAREYAPRVSGDTLEARVRSMAALVAEEGLDFEVATVATGIQLLGRGCPCLRLVGGEEQHARRACDHDRRMLEGVLGQPVHALPPEAVPHEFYCGYEIRIGSPFASDGSASGGGVSG
ncbi:MAG: helix-turn-helix domain-containing protein [Dehalococcoidia bacterium]|nr:helix-turn-helix domain-containing protein [Dehalococcoidia bacterium]